MQYQIVKVTSDQGRLAFLQTSASQGDRDNLQGQAYLSQALVTTLEAFVPQWETAVNNFAGFQGAQSSELHRANAAVDEVSQYVRDIWAVVRRRVRRNQADPAILRYYQLPMRGAAPRPYGREAWLNLATAVIEGDADAVTAGYPPTANPAAAELQTVLTAAEAAMAELAAAQQAYQTAHEELISLRQAADRLILTVRSELRHTLREMSPVQRRAVMRRYGVRYRTSGGSDQIEEEVVESGEEMVQETAVSLTEPMYSNGNGYQPAELESVLAPVNGFHT